MSLGKELGAMWLGLDGCKKRWAGCVVRGCSGGVFAFELKYVDYEESHDGRWRDYQAIAIDTPLTFQDGPVRKADQEGRLYINPSTVFNAPSQTAIDTWRNESDKKPDYKELCKVNESTQKREDGTGLALSKQSVAILDVIDQGLRIQDSALQDGVSCVEAHPELVFASLARCRLDGGFSKAAPAGFFLRVALLERAGFHGVTEALSGRSIDPKDYIDFVDAIACAYVAYLFTEEGVQDTCSGGDEVPCKGGEQGLCHVGTPDLPIYYPAPKLRKGLPSPQWTDLAEALVAATREHLPNRR